MSRFFMPASAWNDPQPALSEEESHHAMDVLRLGIGDRLTVFNGKGRESLARIRAVENRRAVLDLGPRSDTPALPVRVTLAQAIPKGKTMDFILQKAVELGAARIAPLVSERTIVRLDEAEAARKQAKWQETALEACKQCGQNHLPEIDPPRSVAAFLAAGPAAPLTLVGSLQPDARPLKSVLAEFSANPPSQVTVFIGPEGDFTPAELGLVKSHGALPISLGPIVLRTETAALYVLSVLGYEFFLSHG